MSTQSVNLRDVDEVWLALEQADGMLRVDGHRPGTPDSGCRQCAVHGLILSAQNAYRLRLDLSKPSGAAGETEAL